VNDNFFNSKLTERILFLKFFSLKGFGLGLTFIVPMSLVTKWFPEAKGKASAFIFLGMGISGVIFPELSTNYINPLNLSPDRPYSDKFQDEK